ncbi:MAG: aminopeptidase [Acidobacteria bacterium]|nr:aminopeptidase [Acidobacteriota bacterium]
MTGFLLRQDCRRADHSLTAQQRPFSKRQHSLPVFLKTCVGVCCLTVTLSAPSTAQQDSDVRVRAREMGVAPGVLLPGTNNAITDVDGVRVGHTTIYEGDRFRTGVTAILPHNENVFRSKVPAAIVVGNGFGKLAGLSQVQELGTLETPVLLTGTLSVPRVADALMSYMLGLPGNENVRSINPVVGETNDGRLSDIRARPIQPDHVYSAIRGATTGPVREGAVGAGTGTVAFGFKGGIGTSSRIAGETPESWTVGVLVQTNFGARRSLLINGAPVGAMLAEESFEQDTSPGDGSCMIIVATDAPLQHRGLERLGLRALMGMARTGSNFSNGSGDYVIAFSTHPSLRSGPGAGTPPAVRTLPTAAMSPLFQAAIEATEEAIYNSLFMAETVDGFGGRRVEALPLERVRQILAEHGALR